MRYQYDLDSHSRVFWFYHLNGASWKDRNVSERDGETLLGRARERVQVPARVSCSALMTRLMMS